MGGLENYIQNNALASLAAKAPRGVMNAIQHASAKTGVNFAYLVQQANAESNFNAKAKAKTSSASGLYQFIESTWLSMVNKHGDKHGIDTEGKSRSEILALRNDAKTASLMAAEFAGENEKFLNAHWDGEIGSTELYLAHFLGAGGAAGFLKARDDNPMQQAAVLFPKAASANRNVFYDRTTGQARTLDEIYNFFDKKFEINSDIKPEPMEKQKPAHNSLYASAPSVVRRSYYSPASAYQLVSSPVEIMLLAQMDLPINRKNDDFTLFSAKNFLR